MRYWCALAAVVMLAGIAAGCSYDDPQAVQSSCVVTVAAGEDIGAALAAQPSGATVCLRPGRHGPLTVGQPIADGITLQGAGPDSTTIAAEQSDGLLVLDAAGFTLADVTVDGGRPAGIYAARATDLTLRNVRVQSATFGIHIDDSSTSRFDDVTVTGSETVGVLLRRGATLTGERVYVSQTAGTGVSAVAGAASLELRDSEIDGTNGPGLFAGQEGCATLGPGTLDVPPCFYENLPSFVGDARVTLERLTIHNGKGTGLVFFPGVQAQLHGATVTRQELTGLFAWGADVEVVESEFADNAEHGIEYRAYPDPRGEVLRAGTGTIRDTIVRTTRPLHGSELGGGVLSQGVPLTVRHTEVQENHGIGVSYQTGARGEVAANIIVNNDSIGLCIGPSADVEVHDNLIGGNRSDNPDACR